MLSKSLSRKTKEDAGNTNKEFIMFGDFYIEGEEHDSDDILEIIVIPHVEENTRVGLTGILGSLAAFKDCPRCEQPSRQWNAGGFVCRRCMIRHT